MRSLGKSALHTFGFLLRLSRPQTQTSEAEQQALREFAAGRKRAVEIGVFEGASTRIIAEGLAPDGKLFAIDPFFRGRVGICWGEMIARGEVRRSGCTNKVIFVRALSHEAAKLVDGLFDFIFIDGDHSLDGIRRDWEDWSPRVEHRGLMLLHDTHVPPHNPAVAHLGSCAYFQEVIRLDPRFELLRVVDSLSVLRRR